MIHEFSKRLVITEETADKLKRTFKGLFAIVDIFTTLTGGALKAAIKVASRLLGMVDVDILDITANVGDAIVAFRDWIDEHNFLAKGIEKALPYLESGIKTFRNWVSSLGELPLSRKRSPVLAMPSVRPRSDSGSIYRAALSESMRSSNGQRRWTL